MREATENQSPAGRLWSVVVTDDATRFPTMLVLTPGDNAPPSREIEERVEAFAAGLPEQDRLIDLVEAQLDQGRGFIIV